MSEDFYINYSCASRWDGFGTRFYREPPHQRVDALTPLLRCLIQSDVDPGKKHICPVCGQIIELAFEYYVEIKELDIATDCKTCNMQVYFKSNKIPVWAEAISIFDLPGFID